MMFELSAWRPLHDVVGQVLAQAAPQSAPPVSAETRVSAQAVHNAEKEFGGATASAELASMPRAETVVLYGITCTGRA